MPADEQYDNVPPLDRDASQNIVVFIGRGEGLRDLTIGNVGI